MSYPADYALDEGQRRFWRDTSVGRKGPKIVCLVGSTRFKQAFIEANFRETMAGAIVLTVGWFSHADAEVYAPSEDEKAALDQLHLWKVALADEVLVVSQGGYIGDSTAREIAHAKRLHKPIRYLEPAAAEAQAAQDLAKGTD